MAQAYALVRTHEIVRKTWETTNESNKLRHFHVLFYDWEIFRLYLIHTKPFANYDENTVGKLVLWFNLLLLHQLSTFC